MKDKQYSVDALKDMIARWLGNHRVPSQFNIISDTTDFYRVDYGDVAILDHKPYLILNNEREGRFGIEEQQKFWVKRARDLTDGSVKIIKLVFRERFTAKIGGIVFECFRSPKKEARILELTKNHQRFMQGFSVKDQKGNIVRILNFIPGETLSSMVTKLRMPHEEYYVNHFPKLLDEYTELVKEIQFLHQNGEKHGDIRRDHIIWQKEEGKGIWIDFDFNYIHKESMFAYDLFGLGNIFVFLTGGGDITIQDLQESKLHTFKRITIDDMNIIFNNRLVNLQKVFPYISDSLNFVLMHFSQGANTFYENTEQLLSELYEAKESLTA